MYAPIVLFTYNRPDKTRRVLDSLIQNAEAKDSDIFIFSDGPKNEVAVEGVKANREYIHYFQDNSKNFRSVTIIEREKNWGLANSLIAGITEVINQYERVIVVEDDLVLSPYFLKFMNEGLEKYEKEEKVGAISGFLPPINSRSQTTFFLTYFDCWGWATWKRSWDLLNLDTKFLLRKLRFKMRKYDMYDGIYGTLYCQKVGLVDSWYVRFYASLFLAGKLTLFPPQALVTNAGLDGSGTHCAEIYDVADYVDSVSFTPVNIDDIEIRENNEMMSVLQRFFKSRHGKKKLIDRYNDLKSFIRRLLYIDCL